jgi:dethiobiotin synthetase
MKAPPLRPVPIPGLFITGTDTGVGKTVVAGAIAAWFRRQGNRVAVLKPLATGCERRREGLVSTDAEFLAHCADSPHPLDVVCPQRFAEPLAPSVAAERAGTPVDWAEVQRSLDTICRDCDVIIIEGVGGVMVPLDNRHTVLDLAKWLRLPAVVVARAGLGTINHTLLTVDALRQVTRVAGVVVNRYPAENAGVAEETNPMVIARWGRTPVLCVVPDEPMTGALPSLPAGVVAAIEPVDWQQFATQA